MRGPKRIPKILKEIEDIWERHPDLRLGQLICNFIEEGLQIYYIEDEELVEKLKASYKNSTNI